MKLKCFNCGMKFKTRKEIFRNRLNYPLCEDCLFDELYDDWADEFIEDILEEIRAEFNGNYNRWRKKFFETHEECIGCRGKYYDKMFFLKDMLVEIDGSKYCEECMIEKTDDLNEV